MNTIILCKEDINNPIHPFLWEGICEDLGIDRDAESITLKVARAYDSDKEGY